MTCGAEAKPEAKFCIDCGAPFNPDARYNLPDAAASSEKALASSREQTDPADVHAERRQVTVLFSDLVGSTAISGLLDPEDYRELIAQYRILVTDIVARYDGSVANFVGDGVVVYFGYPAAHESSAYAAALAGLDIVDAAPGIGRLFKDYDLQTEVRVGLHTGFVVIGQTGSGIHEEKRSLFGDTPNIAARIQAHAKAGQTLASASTRRLIGSQLVFKSLGLQALNGVREPIELFQAHRPTTASAFIESHTLHPKTPTIGRHAEIALVATRWNDAIEGDGQVMVISGEAGIGKSRIVFAMDQELAEGTTSRLALFGSVIHKNSAFYSVRLAFEALLGLADSDSIEFKREKLLVYLADLKLDPVLVGEPILELLGVPDATGMVRPPSFPEREKTKIIKALLQLCAAMSERKPLLMLIDDVHWIDPSTLEFLSRWIEAMPLRRCLMLITARPEFESPWKNLAHVSALELNRLGRRESIKLIESIVGRPMPEPLMQQIVSRTDGVPLFIEELTKMIVEAGFLEGTADFREDLLHSIPESLQASLLARLDRMSEVKEVAQVAAAIGRTFQRPLLARVQGGSDALVQAALTKLIDADLVVPVGDHGDEPTYRFRHALVQEAAYQSMLRVSQVKWHGKIAEVLERDFPDTAEREPELLAHHFTLARNHLKAETYWFTAARVAMSRSASVEAIEHLRQALANLAHSPATAERDRRELDLQIAVAVPLASVHGYAQEKVRTAYARARDLCGQYGETEKLFMVVYGQFRSALIGGEYASALEHAELLVSLLDGPDNPVLTAASLRSLGSVLIYLGRPHDAMIHLERGLKIELTMEDRRHSLGFDVVDLPVALHAYSAIGHWLAGSSHAARTAIEKALVLAHETDHPFSISFSSAFASWVYQFLGDEAALKKCSADLIALSESNTFHFWLGWGRIMNGWARREELGDTTLDVIEQGLAEWHGTASGVGSSYFAYLHADAALYLNQFDKARELIGAAQSFERTSGEAFWRPELIRLNGEIANRSGDLDSAQQFWQQAHDIAAETGMRFPQLRAAVSIARAADGPSGRTHAVELLGKVLSELEEDSQAATDAKALLRALEQQGSGPE
ncbi:hypothetical protein EI545_19185 [Tabrizicola piscis]|uniref:Guanylate cyclase domain-containing protein n=1 Tax=Tabrizicola piscis TaxID=2494374 RepID=A0A3S8UAV4_9RHOB|nr:adenylate/guanylate cyclase domain-containing protein [Tabrizicola piscis]AZL60757.1 hypothetical protein EI545_19185 [Tabrizicola piscis]